MVRNITVVSTSYFHCWNDNWKRLLQMKNGSMLLGVVATSIPIKHLINTVPRYQVHGFLSSFLLIVIHEC